MSARDDASSLEARSRGRRALTLALATLAGAAVGVVVALLGTPADRPFFETVVAWSGPAPVAREWPREPRAGESATLHPRASGRDLVLRTPRAPEARELAAALLARRNGAMAELLDARSGLLHAWQAGDVAGPRLERSPAVRTASLLLAAARQRRGQALAAPSRWRPADAQAPDAAAPPSIAEALADLERAALTGDAAATADALVGEATVEEDWFASPSAPREGAWRAWQLDAADSLDALAALAVGGRANALDSAKAAEPFATAELAGRMPPPYDGLLRAIAPGPAPEASAIASAWGRWLGMGALLGGLVSLLAALAGFALRAPRTRPEPRVPVTALSLRDPAARGAWLHVVAGPTPAAIARAALELASHALARGERVLVVDGGPKLRLHERFGREARWGLMECLLADMPIIGLIQYGGRPGFYLLAHGNPARGEGWAALGQRLDDARPHFGRVILALDSGAPRAIGDALAGRALEGWWAATVERLPRAADDLTARLGIAFSSLDLSAVEEVSLQALGERVGVLIEHRPAEPDAPVAMLPVALPEPLPTAPLEPVVLDCDLQVQQRLRFLAWMRRVQSERRRSEVGSAS